MNYRHQYHAGNFADVMKHALLLQLGRHLQRKPKGFVYIDTHAGRGRYDLERAALGESLARKPEWPEGIGRLWNRPGREMPDGIAHYVEQIREFDRAAGNLETSPRFYPGSPALVQRELRADDRMVLCEKHPEEFAALKALTQRAPRVSVQETDGYAALSALLPPRERRALVLIDPPFEAQDEFEQITAALASGLKRFPAGVFAIWYPLTVRARVDEFIREIHALNPPPTLAVELAIAGPSSPLKMKGCGMVVVNPPWQFDAGARPMMEFLADVLAQDSGGFARLDWIVPEVS